MIKELANEYPIKRLCKVLKIPRSTYYKALVYAPSNKKIEFYAFGERVSLAYPESKGHYGAPNQKWVTDITYIYTLKDGWTYLACVLDLYLHKVIGYTYDRHMTARMATQAVRNAALGVTDTTGIIIHSDLGSQYTSQEFEDYLTEKKMLHSFSRKGNPYDNACIESFHAALKKEEVYTKVYVDFEDAQRAIFE